MKKIKMILFTLLISLIMINVSAKTVEEIKEDITESLTNYQLEIKYDDMTEIIDYLKNSDSALADDIKNRVNPYSIFLVNYVKADIGKKIDFSEIAGVDVSCYIEGDSYTDNDDNTQIADTTFCDLQFMIISENNDYPAFFSKLVDITFTKVDGDEQTSKKALELVKQLNKPVYIYDIDMLNHYINYDSETSTFFDSENSIHEFSELKKVKEQNPEFNFFIGFEDTRRGIGTIGFAIGSTFIIKDEIVYGFTYNAYNQGNLFVVPLDTPINDLEEALEKRLKEYTKGTDTEIEVLPGHTENMGWDYDVMDIVDVVPGMFGVTEEEYYRNVNTSLALEKSKMEANGLSCDYEDRCIIGYVRSLKINDKTYDITIVPYDYSKLKNVGTISTLDAKTGVMLTTSSNNIPLDASLNTTILELTEEEKELLEKNGYDAVSGYNLLLYSKILDKYISNFNSPATVLIPIDNYNENLQMVYVKDNNEIETYDVELVTIENKNYLLFKTLHFSKYYVANKTEEKNPNTNDYISNYLIISLISVSGLIGTTLYLKKNNKIIIKTN